MKYYKAALGLIFFFRNVKIFNPNKVLKSKRVAIIGAADSALKHEAGEFIDSFDFVIRLNKALITYSPENTKYIGSKTDLLLHNFHENLDSGGAGPIDWETFEKFQLKYLIQAKADFGGLRNLFNYFKKYLNDEKKVYRYSINYYRKIKKMFGNFHPTKGFCALYMALKSEADEIYITGFTFFKTDYADGYRDNIKTVKANLEHIKNQGLHDPELEFQNFLKILKNSTVRKIYVDTQLYQILLLEGGIQNVKLVSENARFN